MSKRTLGAALLAALSIGIAQAHGIGVPKHGGTVSAAAGMSFELVVDADGTSIYIEDHDLPVAPTGLTGKLSVLAGGEKAEAELVAAGPRLLARGIKVASGAIVVAVLQNAAGQSLTVRFVQR
jgi:hypothetical protein